MMAKRKNESKKKRKGKAPATSSTKRKRTKKSGTRRKRKPPAASYSGSSDKCKNKGNEFILEASGALAIFNASGEPWKTGDNRRDTYLKVAATGALEPYGGAIVTARKSSGPPAPRRSLVKATPKILSAEAYSLLSEQQKAVVDTAKPPGIVGGKLNVVRVTAGAGTGKTTTLEHLAMRLLDEGHKSILYCVFNRAAAKDAKARLPKQVMVKTVHASAYTALADADFDEDEEEMVLATESRMEKEIEKLCRTDVDEMVENVVNAKQKLKARRLVLFFIKKTLANFCRGAECMQRFMKSNYSTYYPAKLWHGGKHDRIKTPEGIRKNPGSFYIDCARAVWESLLSSGAGGKGKLTTFDAIVKRAQLAQARLPVTACLIDESQDLDAAQIDFLCNQAKLQGTHLYFVGDAVQTIYSFRGAKSINLTNLGTFSSQALSAKHNVIDLPLTHCWRFNPVIANVGNSILYVKEKSPQTIKKKTWHPYRLKGCGSATGRVVTKAFGRDNTPFTVIAFSNYQLLDYTLGMLSSDKWIGVKFTLNGNSETTGRRGWINSLKVIEKFYHVYDSEKDEMPPPDVPEYADMKNELMTWEELVDDVKVRQMGRLERTCVLIEKYGKNTMQVLDQFRREVLDKNFAASDADIILSTIHSAKGMEWEKVQVLGGSNPSTPLKPLSNYCFSYGEEFNRNFGRASSMHSLQCWFDYPEWGDDLNLWYVAMTRAKEVLSVPGLFVQMLSDMSAIKRAAKGGDVELKIVVEGKPKHLDKHQIDALLSKIVDPWIEEMKQNGGGRVDLTGDGTGKGVLDIFEENLHGSGPQIINLVSEGNDCHYVSDSDHPD